MSIMLCNLSCVKIHPIDECIFMNFLTITLFDNFGKQNIKQQQNNIQPLVETGGPPLSEH